MATPVFCCGFECGVVAATGHFAVGSGASSFSTTTFRSGLRALRINPSASIITVDYMAMLTAATRKYIGRVYVRFATLPSTDGVLAYFFNSAGTEGCGIAFKQSDHTIRTVKWSATAVTLSASGVSVTTGVWYRLDYAFNTSANPWTIDGSVDGTALPQTTFAVAADTPQSMRLGCGGIANGTISIQNISADLFYDDMIVSQTTADYPIGVGEVHAYLPVSDGTHTSTSTNILEGTTASPTAGPAITVATTDAYTYVNATGPIGGGASDATRLINQQTNASTEYAEVAWGPNLDTAPRAVEVIYAHRETDATSGNHTMKLNDNGTENTILAFSGAGSTSDRYGRKHYALMPADSGAWTNTRFNALKARYGYSSDAAPDQYWRGIMIEAEFVSAPGQLGNTVVQDPIGGLGIVPFAR